MCPGLTWTVAYAENARTPLFRKLLLLVASVYQSQRGYVGLSARLRPTASQRASSIPGVRAAASACRNYANASMRQRITGAGRKAKKNLRKTRKIAWHKSILTVECFCRRTVLGRQRRLDLDRRVRPQTRAPAVHQASTERLRCRWLRKQCVGGGDPKGCLCGTGGRGNRVTSAGLKRR